MNGMASMLPQMLIDGLTLGFVYAIVAIGYTMVYGALEFINWAHGDMFMFGAFVGTETLLFFKGRGILDASPALGLFGALVMAIVITGLLGVGIERVAYKPLRNAPKLVPLISAFGVSFFLEDAVRMVEGLARNAYFLNAPIMYDARVKIGSSIDISFKTIIVLVIGVIMMALLTLFVNKTKIGKAIRAVAQDRTCASLMAVNVNAIISTTFLVGAGMGGAAGLLFAVQYSLIHPLVGFLIGLKAFVAAVLGGIGNIPGAMLGGIMLGLVESLGSGYLSVVTNGNFGAEYKDVFAFVILIAVLIFKPSGLLGKAVSEKV
jgi:branched-chain amino acid transport system permease protein